MQGATITSSSYLASSEEKTSLACGVACKRQPTIVTMPVLRKVIFIVNLNYFKEYFEFKRISLEKRIRKRVIMNLMRKVISTGMIRQANFKINSGEYSSISIYSFARYVVASGRLLELDGSVEIISGFLEIQDGSSLLQKAVE